MNRRDFLRCSASFGFSMALGNLFSCAQIPKVPGDRALLKDLRTIDAHAHPDRYVRTRQAVSSSLDRK